MNKFKLEPAVGDVKRACEIGYQGTSRYIWHSCVDCGKQRWVQFLHNCPRNLRCYSCANKGKTLGRTGEQSPTWKGGRTKDSEGYIHIKLQPGDPFYAMVDCRGYVREHRLMMAKHLGRCLTRLEIVDHRDGSKDHNEIVNLRLTTAKSHNQKTDFEAYQLGYQDAIAIKDRETRKQIRLLRWEIKQLREALQLRLGERHEPI